MVMVAMALAVVNVQNVVSVVTMQLCVCAVSSEAK
jgi:hypothetical protein